MKDKTFFNVTKRMPMISPSISPFECFDILINVIPFNHLPGMCVSRTLHFEGKLCLGPPSHEVWIVD